MRKTARFLTCGMTVLSASMLLVGCSSDTPESRANISYAKEVSKPAQVTQHRAPDTREAVETEESLTEETTTLQNTEVLSTEPTWNLTKQHR